MEAKPSQVGWGFWLYWVLASTVGWGLSMAVGGAFEFMAAGLFALPVGGAVLGAVTGGTLIWLLRQPIIEA